MGGGSVLLIELPTIGQNTAIPPPDYSAEPKKCDWAQGKRRTQWIEATKNKFGEIVVVGLQPVRADPRHALLEPQRPRPVLPLIEGDGV